MARKEISSKIEIYKSLKFYTDIKYESSNMMNIIYNSYFLMIVLSNIYLLFIFFFFLSLNLKPLFFPFFYIYIFFE